LACIFNPVGYPPVTAAIATVKMGLLHHLCAAANGNVEPGFNTRCCSRLDFNGARNASLPYLNKVNLRAISRVGTFLLTFQEPNFKMVAKRFKPIRISAMRTKVLEKCYGGDISRKKTPLNKKRARHKMRKYGRVSMLQVAFYYCAKDG
jgi:hypothetical protein